MIISENEGKLLSKNEKEKIQLSLEILVKEKIKYLWSGAETNYFPPPTTLPITPKLSNSRNLVGSKKGI